MNLLLSFIAALVLTACTGEVTKESLFSIIPENNTRVDGNNPNSSGGGDSGGGDSGGGDSGGGDSGGGAEVVVDNTIRFVSVGNNGTIMTSPDANNWTLQTSPTAENLHKVRVFDNAIYIVGDRCTILKSTDAISWEQIAVPLTCTFHLYDFAFVPGHWYFAGSGSTYGHAKILVSTNLATWTISNANSTENLTGVIPTYLTEGYISYPFHTTGDKLSYHLGRVGGNYTTTQTFNSGHSVPFYSLAYVGTDIFNVGGSGTIVKKATNFSLTTLTTGISSDLRDIVYSGSLIVVVGDNPHVIITSSDGTTWTDQSYPSGDNLYGAAYGHSKYVAVGENGAIYYSSDGASWSSSSSGTSNRLNSVSSVDLN